LQATQKQFRRLSVQPGPRGSNDLRVVRKMPTFSIVFFQSGRAKDLSAPLYKHLLQYIQTCTRMCACACLSYSSHIKSTFGSILVQPNKTHSVIHCTYRILKKITLCDL